MESHPISYPIDAATISHRERVVVAIGDFDGVHLGHQNVINYAINLGRSKGLRTAVMTFNPHPRQVLGESKHFKYLAPLPKKLEIFEQLGVDYTWLVQFDHQFAQVSPAQFVDQMLIPLHVDTVVVGFDFTFGHKGEGTTETLKSLCAGKMNVEVIKPFNINGEKVSSTLIREQLHLGRVEQIKLYTGRDYAISGQVVTGERRGSSIGFPTANIALNAPYVVPKQGVYAVQLRRNKQTHYGVMNIGVKPTFHDQAETEPTLEVHILDFEEMIYGEEVVIQFISFIRREQKFASVGQLVKQIQQDITQARALF